MNGLMRALGVLMLMTVQLAVALPVALVATPAMAVPGEFCFVSGSNPGLKDSSDVCQTNTPAQGAQCGTSGLYFNTGAATCVANNDSCTPTGGGNGFYTNGVCGAPPTPVTPTQPTQPTAFSPDLNASGTPNSEMQPMCTNASPFIGGGMFVVSGTVLCYTGAGRNTNIYSYSSQGDGTSVIDRPAWDSLAMQNLYASGDITTTGTLSVFGGAQIYSLNGRNGLQVNDSGVLIRSTDGSGNVAGINTTPGKIVSSATDGVSNSSVTIDGGKGVSIYGQIGSTSTDRVGVVVSGDGQGNALPPTSGPAGWADVLVASKSYNGTAGTAVIVNDYGMTSRTGSTSMTMIQGALDYSTSGGNSTLAGAAGTVSGGSSTVMAGAAARHVVMDANGRMTVVNGVAAEASTSMQVTNGYGTTNGVMANEHTAAISGGTSNPTTLALTDGGARFSGANGDPVTVSGIADGKGPMDAANIRQLDGSIASIAALAGIPAPQAGKDNSMGIGMGQHGSGMAVAVGGQSLIGDALTIKYGASVSYSGGLVDSSTMLGVGVSW